MYASTKKQTPLGTFAFIAVLALGLAIGGYFLFSYWQDQQESPLEISLNSPSDIELPAASPIEEQENTEPLEESAKADQALQKENDALIESISELESQQAKSEQLKVGRAVLSDFANRLFKYETVLNNKSFFQFFNKLVLDYIENRAISVKEMNISDPLFRKLHQDFVDWVVGQEDQKMQALARFVGFYVIEHLYHLPLTLLASGLSSEIEVIDFNLPVFVLDQETTPRRDQNGELKMEKRAHLEGYTSAQQFMYRRGPLFSAKVMVFLQTYLEYEGY
ncbi:MAG: hypothetical protein HQM13_16020 [SAR324 cluster bacterium]|nr:hypothetical protein [SAR324 cluster bacterium]